MSEKQLLHFLDEAKCAPLASKYIQDEAIKHGAKQVLEHEKLTEHCICRRGNSLALLKMNKRQSGIKIVVGHLDFPSLKLKPKPDYWRDGYLELGVELYGAPQIPSWFDRSLSIAGFIYSLDKKDQLHETLVDFKRPVAGIYSPALHLNRSINDKREIDRQKELKALILKSDKKSFIDLIANEFSTKFNDHKIINHCLYFYDTQPACYSGIDNEFINAQGLDNLLSSYVILKSYLNAKENVLFLLFDYEEIGSLTFSGARGNFLSQILMKLYPNSQDFINACRNSFLLSLDVTHGWQPNYSQFYDENHKAILNEGPVFKYSSLQRYTSTAKAVSILQKLWQEIDLKYQHFSGHNNIPSGSTVGPLVSTKLGIEAVDLGVPIMSMHSIRETSGRNDVDMLIKGIDHFIDQPLPKIVSSG